MMGESSFYSQEAIPSLAKIIEAEINIAYTALHKALDNGLEVPWQLKSYLGRSRWKMEQLSRLLDD